MAEEKVFTINLRREFSKKPGYQRAKKAVTAVKEFISKHLKVKEVKVGGHLNQKIHERGRKHPPPKVKVKAIVKENIAYVELPEFEFNIPKHKEEEEKQKTTKESEQEVKKEKEKELQKELSHEEKAKHKKETIEKPSKEVKEQEKVKDSVQRETKVIGRTGKKGTKDPKP